MSRLHGLLVAGGLMAAGALGCAHCDTCDDFPAPCVGPHCADAGLGHGAPVTVGPVMPIGPVVETTPGVMPMPLPMVAPAPGEPSPPLPDRGPAPFAPRSDSPPVPPNANTNNDFDLDL